MIILLIILPKTIPDCLILLKFTAEAEVSD
ncbi:hypothetical protein BJ928_11739 [Rhizobium sp. WW_1]|jgi:hypothetical protein|nr:hypothetical protein BJ928_11739 [Rhizobium sp. WW_1]